MSPTPQVVDKLILRNYVTDALTWLFLGGAPMSSPTIQLDFTAVSATTTTTLIVGMLLFRKYGKT